jgi:RNA polymerase sigma-70 factor, ECF subfamily
VTQDSLAWEDDAGPGAAAPPEEAQPCVRDVVVSQFGFVWRLLRHLGVPAADVDDAAQQVFLVAAAKLGEIAPGRERSFLYGVALRTASKARHANRLRAARDVDGLDLPDPASCPEQQLDSARKRALFDEALQAMDLDLRAVFVLHEIERMTMREIATTLDIPPGTVASRLRRARDEFRERVMRIDARLSSRGGLR